MVPTPGPPILKPFIFKSLADIPPFDIADPPTPGIPLWPSPAVIGAPPLLLEFEFSYNWPWLLKPVVLSAEPAVYYRFMPPPPAPLPAPATGFC